MKYCSSCGRLETTKKRIRMKRMSVIECEDTANIYQRQEISARTSVIEFVCSMNLLFPPVRRRKLAFRLINVSRCISLRLPYVLRAFEYVPANFIPLISAAAVDARLFSTPETWREIIILMLL